MNGKKERLLQDGMHAAHFKGAICSTYSRLYAAFYIMRLLVRFGSTEQEVSNNGVLFLTGREEVYMKWALIFTTHPVLSFLLWSSECDYTCKFSKTPSRDEVWHYHMRSPCASCAISVPSIVNKWLGCTVCPCRVPFRPDCADANRTILPLELKMLGH